MGVTYPLTKGQKEMNYEIIKDEKLLREFIDWLPELKPSEAFYCSLLARNKYDKSIPSDKISLKRFTADKKYLFRKIKQLEVEVGAYTAGKEDTPIPQNALALYICVNPRDLEKAAKNTLIELARKITQPYDGYNPNSLSLSEIQKANGTTHFCGFDFDGIDFTETFVELEKIINTDCLSFIFTIGGFHTLVEINKILPEYKKNWYNKIKALKKCDAVGTAMMSPIPGTIQGDYVPTLVK